MPFERFEKTDREEYLQIKRYIGAYVSHKVVCDGRTTVEELNGLDRWDLAYKWYVYETGSSPWKTQRIGKTINRYYGGDIDAFLEEVAVFIDDRIPKAYMKHHAHEGKQPGCYEVVCDEEGNLPFGLIYLCKENRMRTEAETKTQTLAVKPATEKQIRYIENLAWRKNHYFYKEKGISKKEASECIDYLLDMDYRVEPACFARFFKPTL